MPSLDIKNLPYLSFISLRKLDHHRVIICSIVASNMPDL